MAVTGGGCSRDEDRYFRDGRGYSVDRDGYSRGGDWYSGTGTAEERNS